MSQAGQTLWQKAPGWEFGAQDDMRCDRGSGTWCLPGGLDGGKTTGRPRSGCTGPDTMLGITSFSDVRV